MTRWNRSVDGGIIRWTHPDLPNDEINDYIPFGVASDSACVGHLGDSYNNKYAVWQDGKYWICGKLSSAKAKLEGHNS